jgi:quercetin dioxygenase-like cupin family protein
MPIIRTSELPIDDLDEGVLARRILGAHRGSKSITGGYSIFTPGSKILLHTHPCEEMVVVVEGEMVAEIEGVPHVLHPYDTAFVHPNTPHRFLNQSTEQAAMMYFYPMAETPRDPVNPEDASE